MKKLFLGAALAMGSLAFAQQFGVKAGMNVSNVSNSDAKSKVGFNAGVFMNAPIAESFSIQPEVLYNNLGAKNGNTTLNLDYIAVPVMFQYKATPEFYLEAGPEFGFLVSAKAKNNGNKADVKDGMETFNFGVGVGAGYYFTQNIGINARYVAGFTDVAKNNSGDAARNGVFQVGLNYKF
ncbi:MAG: porin family protein [Cruoricaptor ignavus]|nr:porin family protein [Cruoricaptor ignavus]